MMDESVKTLVPLVEIFYSILLGATPQRRETIRGLLTRVKAAFGLWTETGLPFV